MYAGRKVKPLSVSNRLVASAYIVYWNLELALIISLMFIRKKIGSITDAYGTALNMEPNCEVL